MIPGIWLGVLLRKVVKLWGIGQRVEANVSAEVRIK